MEMSSRSRVRSTTLTLVLGALVLALVSGCEGMLVGRTRDTGPSSRDGGVAIGDGACPGCTDAGPRPDGAPPIVDSGARPDAFVPLTCDGVGDPQPLSLSVLSPTGPDLIAPGRGAERWHDQFYVDVPSEGTDTTPLDVYHRFSWTQFERSEGVYDWSRFDGLLDDAIEHRQAFSFGIMTACPGCPVDYNGLVMVDGSPAAYPADLHRDMQAESVHDWVSDGYWVPNWNSPSYLARLDALLHAIDEHLETGEHMGVRYRDAIGYIDVRGYGSWGEWHVYGIADTVDDQPSGTRATAATLTRLVDMHVDAFPSHALVLMICTFDGGRFPNMGVPVEVATHALSVENDFGPLGWRRDNWGATDDYIRWLLDWNTGEAGGVSVADEVMSRWQTSPVVGEPPGFDPGGSCAYDELEDQVRLFHATSFGNGNYGGTEGRACMRDNIRAAARASGYRLVVEGGTAEPELHLGGPVSISLRWHNVGLTPTYEPWEVVYELRTSGGDVVWSGTSSFEPRLFLPAATATEVTDALVLPDDVVPGTYELAMVVRDPRGFRAPLPLANEGRRADGSYALRTVTVSDCP